MSRSRGAAAPPPVAEKAKVDTSAGEIGAALKQIEKLHGPGMVRKGNERAVVKHIPSGIFTLDIASLGGFPEGRTTLIYGHASAGKSTLLSRGIAGAQKKYPDKVAVLVDLEHTYDPVWGERHGVDNEKLLLVQPGYGEQALDMAEALLKAEETSFLGLDSIAALLPMKKTSGPTRTLRWQKRPVS